MTDTLNTHCWCGEKLTDLDRVRVCASIAADPTRARAVTDDPIRRDPDGHTAFDADQDQ